MPEPVTPSGAGSKDPISPARKLRRRIVLPGLIVAAAVALLALLVFGVSRQVDHSSLDAKVAAGQLPVLPDASMNLPLLGSTTQSLSLKRFRGKVVVLNFFASWCTACRAEAPLMTQEQKVLRRHGGTIVGVTYEDSPTSTESFDHQLGVSWPVLRDPTGTFARALGDGFVPETFILNPQGRVEAINRYQVSPTWLKTHVAQALRAQQS